MTILAALCLLLNPSLTLQGPLHSFVSAPEPDRSFRRVSSGEGVAEFRLVSQKWKDRLWSHSLVVVSPKKLVHTDTVLLVITGDRVDRSDQPLARALAEASGMRVAMLFDVPNQPLWGMREDEIIAHTFAQYMGTGDASWPLLMPMAKSAAAAMDALSGRISGEASLDPQPKKFVVTGASKRGWTTWLVGALGDPRVIGLAPAVFDFLDFPSQLKRQLELWGGYSEMIGDYTELGLQQALETDRGKELQRAVDPVHALASIRVPILALTGANDRYWATDATRLYWDRLPSPKALSITPNAGHSLGDGQRAIAAIGAFADAAARKSALPEVRGRWNPDTNTYEARAEGAMPRAWTVWVAEEDSLDFRTSVWRARELEDGPSASFVAKPGERSVAFFLEARFEGAGRAFTLATPIRIVPKK